MGKVFYLFESNAMYDVWSIEQSRKPQRFDGWHTSASIKAQAHPSKHYHLGFGAGVSRSNLANANEKRDYQIFEQFAYDLIAQACECCIADSDFNLSITGNAYAFDASVIDLCLNVFWWAKFRKNKGAIKLDTLYDIKTSIPTFIHITTGSVHDVHGLDAFVYQQHGYYIL